LLVWWDFVGFDPWIRLVLSWSSIPLHFPPFHPSNPTNFHPEISIFCPKTRPRSENLALTRFTGRPAFFRTSDAARPTGRPVLTGNPANLTRKELADVRFLPDVRYV
jgi:hypothetical protein